MKLSKIIAKDNATYEDMAKNCALEPFSSVVVEFLGALSREILNDGVYRKYNDVTSFAFFIRKQNILKLKESMLDNCLRLGKGLAFHIAPSNVPINFAYSLVAGLLSGNVNIIKISSKNFEQVDLLCNTIKKLLTKPEYGKMSNYITVVQYNNEKDITDYFSSICNTRLIWGGDNTINEIRKSPLSPRSTDITFANRYSLCLINASAYLSHKDSTKCVADFYNDSYGFDQNACFSPRLVYWVGSEDDIKNARSDFWNRLRELAKTTYNIEDSVATEKQMATCRTILLNSEVKVETEADNLLYRCEIKTLHEKIFDTSTAGGFFIEYNSQTLDGLKLIDSKQIQTLSVLGYDKTEIANFVTSNGMFGIDRITDVGKAHEFTLVWDGVNLITALSRVIVA